MIFHCTVSRPARALVLIPKRWETRSAFPIELHRSNLPILQARLINDYRGITERPNAVFEERRTGQGELRMSVWSASKGIKKGEEILVSYGKSWWAARNNISDAKQTPNN